MLSIPAIKRRCDVHGTVHGGCIERQRKWKKAYGDISQSEGERKRVEGSRGESRQNERAHYQAIVVDKRQQCTNQRKQCGRPQEDTARPEQPSDIYREWTDKHERNVVSRADPGAIVKTYAQTSFKIGNA